jgi:hypothetical protein
MFDNLGIESNKRINQLKLIDLLGRKYDGIEINPKW